MFKEYDPLKNKIFRVMDDSGKIINPNWIPDIKVDEIVTAYKKMLFCLPGLMNGISLRIMPAE